MWQVTLYNQAAQCGVRSEPMRTLIGAFKQARERATDTFLYHGTDDREARADAWSRLFASAGASIIRRPGVKLTYVPEGYIAVEIERV